MGIPKILKIIRIHIVAGGLLAFSIGALLALANGKIFFDPVYVVLCYLVVLLGDLSTHYSNDYFDVEVDKIVERKKFFAGSTILVTNPKLRVSAKLISISLLALSTILAVSMVLLYGAPMEFLIIALGENFLGWAYSAPPFRLISRGLGEIAVATVTGFAIPGIGYLALRGHFDPLFVYFAVPFVIYGLILSLSLGAPDREIDRKGGKRNLVVRKGEHTTFSLILAMALLATLLFCVYAWKIKSTVINLGVVLLFSFAPLSAGLLGFVRVLQKKEVNRYSTVNVASLFLFNMLMITYLVATIATK